MEIETPTCPIMSTKNEASCHALLMSTHAYILIDSVGPLMTHKYRGSQQSSREVKPKFIDLTQGEPKNIYKP
jgi:hypothetical protein